MPRLTGSQATVAGLLAILLWSTSVGLLRSISEALGPTGGAALIYTVSAICLVISNRRALSSLVLSWRMLAAGTLFVLYEISLALAVGLASTRAQALEMGMINYLWPGLTLLFALYINQQRAQWFIAPGLLLALGGVIQVMRGDTDWSPAMLLHNLAGNPVAYGLAFGAAIIWALYCNLTRRWSDGQNPVPLFFCTTALVLWVKYLLFPQPPMHINTGTTLELLFMGVSTAVAYSAWNHGLQHGNLTLLATASYFTPVLSAFIASLWLGLTPGWGFWQGVFLVVAGSLLCWLATRRASATSKFASVPPAKE